MGEYDGCDGGELHNLRERAEKAEAALADAQTLHTVFKIEVGKQVESLQAKLAAAQTANEAISKKNDGYRARIAALEAELHEKKKRLVIVEAACQQYEAVNHRADIVLKETLAEVARLKAERCIWDECECRTTGFEDEGMGNGPPDNDAGRLVEPAPPAPDPRDEEIARLKGYIALLKAEKPAPPSATNEAVLWKSNYPQSATETKPAPPAPAEPKKKYRLGEDGMIHEIEPARPDAAPEPHARLCLCSECMKRKPRPDAVSLNRAYMDGASAQFEADKRNMKPARQDAGPAVDFINDPKPKRKRGRSE